MLLYSLIRWWYGLGWRDQLGLAKERLASSADFFSIRLTLRTLFYPFKQIDADPAVKGPLAVIMRGIFDQLFSRVFGAVVRTLLIVVGLLYMLGEMLFGALRVALWPILPVFPMLGLVMAVSGWLPW